MKKKNTNTSGEQKMKSTKKDSQQTSGQAPFPIQHSPMGKEDFENTTHNQKDNTMNTKQRAEMYERIQAHGENLLAIFQNATERDPIALCKKLRRLEAKATRITTDCCNGLFDAGEEGENLDAKLDPILAKVNAILGNSEIPVFINSDPRGYALKIQDAWMIKRREQWDRQIAKQGKKAITPAYWALLRFHRDWGGYGIIAPEITGD